MSAVQHSNVCEKLFNRCVLFYYLSWKYMCCFTDHCSRPAGKAVLLLHFKSTIGSLNLVSIKFAHFQFMAFSLCTVTHKARFPLLYKVFLSFSFLFFFIWLSLFCFGFVMIGSMKDSFKQVNKVQSHDFVQTNLNPTSFPSDLASFPIPKVKTYKPLCLVKVFFGISVELCFVPV